MTPQSEVSLPAGVKMATMTGETVIEQPYELDDEPQAVRILAHEDGTLVIDYSLRDARFERVPQVVTKIRGPNGRTVTSVAVIDSGADQTVLPLEWAQPLGVDLAGTKAKGILYGQTWRDAYEVEQSLVFELVGTGVAFMIAPCFSDAHDQVLLGRQDFFRHYRVTFDQRARQVTLARYEQDLRCRS